MGILIFELKRGRERFIIYLDLGIVLDFIIGAR